MLISPVVVSVIEFHYRTAIVKFNQITTRRLAEMDHRDLLRDFIRLHILHHAVEGELYGQRMIEELARHGYQLSPRTLYPFDIGGLVLTQVLQVVVAAMKFLCVSIIRK